MENIDLIESTEEMKNFFTEMRRRKLDHRYAPQIATFLREGFR